MGHAWPPRALPMIHHDQIDAETRAFVRSVARALARGDDHLADEVEQETLLAALTHRPRDPGARRGWLRTIALNSLRTIKGRAGRGPRLVRWEEGYGVAARSEDPADRFMRDEVRARLDQRLEELTPVMRETIRLRILEGLPPREVAGLLGIPTETVRTRTRRGLERLRESAERDLGARPLEPRRPFLAFLPLLRRPGASVAATAVFIGLVTLAIRSSDPIRDDASETREVALAGATSTAELAAAPDQRTPSRIEGSAVAAGPTVDRAAPTVPTIPGAVPLRIDVVGPDGEPVEGAEIYVRRGIRGHVRHAGRTDDDGVADIEAIPAMRLVAARGAAGWTSRAIVVDQPSVLSSGRVTLALEPHPVAWIDVRGPGADAQDLVLRCEPTNPEVLCRLDAASGGSGAAPWLPAWTDAAGRRGVTWNDHEKSIRVEHAGKIIWRTRPYRPFEPAPRAIDLQPTWSVSGRLITPSGRGVNRFEVTLRPTDGKSDPRRVSTSGSGRFTVDAITDDAAVLLVAGTPVETLHRPTSATTHVDLGSLLLPHSGHGHALALRVHCAPDGPPIRRVAGIEQRERDLWTAHGLLTNHSVVVEAVPDPTAATTRAVRALLVERERAMLSAVVVEYEGDEHPPTIVTRPPAGWSDRPIDVIAHPTAPSSAVYRVGADAGPILTRWTHRDSGFARTVRVEGVTSAGQATTELRSPSLCAGAWDLLVVDGRGRSRVRTGVDFEAGAALDLGRLDDPAGADRSSIDWAPAVAAGAPGDRVVVEVHSRGRVILERAGPRSMLRSGAWIGRTFEPAAHEIVVTSARGVTRWIADPDGNVVD